MNEELSEEQLAELKDFIEEDNNLFGKPKLHVDCKIYEEEYKNKVEAGLEIAKALQLIGLPAAVVLALEAAKKGMDKYCKLS
ncbi:MULTISPECIES: hypothetical protein [Pantoea]|uniref:hypothetical protein n=1 Tax=Pantoea TaxID=53335 RepID=UPI0025809839|nr:MULTISPECIES: hypothetical protein [Pantoea]